MNNDSERVLGMLSEGKITVDEAERLLEALSGNGQTPDGAPDSPTETQTPDFEDDGEESRDEHDESEPIWLGPGIQMGAGASVSPGVKFPHGSVIGMGAVVHEGVVVESAIKIGMGAAIGEGAKIGADAKIDMGAAIGERAKIRAGATIGKGACIGEGAEVPPGSHVPLGGQVPPGMVW